MKRKEEREQAAFEAYPSNISYCTIADEFKDYNRQDRNKWLAGAKWSDEHPDKNNVYTKQELREMGFGFTLNGDIVTPKEEEEMIKKYIEYKQKQLIDKACEWLLKNDSYSKPTEILVRDFRKAMMEDGLC